MTVAAAIRLGGYTWIGSDTVASSWQEKCDCGTKMVHRHNWHCAISGTIRTLDIVRESEAFDFAIKTMSDVHKFRDALLKEHLEKGKAKAVATGDDPLQHSFQALLVTRKFMVRIESDYGILHGVKFLAIGSGSQAASGALWAQLRMDKKMGGRTILENAIRASIALNPGCGGRCQVVLVGK
ncbi:MAG: hypothetical protein WC551_10230 [Patescibacteria group bacterium]